MLITKKIVADKIAAYLHHDITLAPLMDWAEHAMMEDEFEANGLPAIRPAVSRLGVADVRASSCRALEWRGYRGPAANPAQGRAGGRLISIQ